MKVKGFLKDVFKAFLLATLCWFLVKYLMAMLIISIVTILALAQVDISIYILGIATIIVGYGCIDLGWETAKLVYKLMVWVWNDFGKKELK